jgi:hypothetical protein
MDVDGRRAPASARIRSIPAEHLTRMAVDLLLDSSLFVERTAERPINLLHWAAEGGCEDASWLLTALAKMEEVVTVDVSKPQRSRREIAEDLVHYVFDVSGVVDPRALLFHARYRQGLGMQSTVNRLLQRAAEAGHPPSMAEWGRTLRARGDHELCLKWLRQAAASAEPLACKTLSELTSDMDERLLLLQRAAAGGNTAAMQELSLAGRDKKLNELVKARVLHEERLIFAARYVLYNKMGGAHHLFQQTKTILQAKDPHWKLRMLFIIGRELHGATDLWDEEASSLPMELQLAIDM